MISLMHFVGPVTSSQGYQCFRSSMFALFPGQKAPAPQSPLIWSLFTAYLQASYYKFLTRDQELSGLCAFS